jgi:hypothetical protein
VTTEDAVKETEQSMFIAAAALLADGCTNIENDIDYDGGDVFGIRNPDGNKWTVDECCSMCSAKKFGNAGDSFTVANGLFDGNFCLCKDRSSSSRKSSTGHVSGQCPAAVNAVSV